MMKLNPYGLLHRVEARMVAKGCFVPHTKEIGNDETLSSVLKISFGWICISLVVP